MTNDQLISEYAEFNNEVKKTRSGSLSCSHNRLYSYATLIAYEHLNVLYITKTKYSVTTSRHVNLLLEHVSAQTIIRVTAEELAHVSNTGKHKVSTR